MSLTYRKDEDLNFLKLCDNDDLDILVKYIIQDKDGDERFTEELTTEDRYINNAPDHIKYWDLIAAELQCFGGNTFATILRGGKGVPYKEILEDVCKKMKVNYNSNASVEIIESALLFKILTDSMEKMDPADLKDLVESLDLKTTNYSKQAVTAALQTLALSGGFATYQAAVIVANAVAKALLGRGLTLAANATLTRTLGVFLGPIGWIITALWTVLDVAGPAFRVTIPSVIQIAYMRAKINFQ